MYIAVGYRFSRELERGPFKCFTRAWRLILLVLKKVPEKENLNLIFIVNQFNPKKGLILKTFQMLN